MSIYIIAEAGVNHDGSLNKALQLVDAAKKAGVDAVQFQTFKAEKLAIRNSIKAKYQEKNTGVSESQWEMLKRLELDEKAHKKLFNYCNKKGLHFLSTPFDMESLDFLVNNLQVTRLKISSGDITNAPLLLKTAQSGKEVILSTGMATLGEIETALGILAFGYLKPDAKPSYDAFWKTYFSEKGQNELKKKVTLMHCTTEYPAPFDEVNLGVIDILARAFELPVGYSDHTLGIAVSIAAVARGAVIIEKHFTLNKNLPGPDHKASLEPDELELLVRSIRQTEAAKGCSKKIPTVSEIKNKPAARKSLVASKEISKGEKFTEENMTVKRPGNGVSPIQYWAYLGRKAEKKYKEDEVIKP
jgi:N-acetylneuraminate synthase